MKDKVILSGSVTTAIAASLCCLGPLLAVALGLGSFRIATTFETLRPYLLGLTALLLAGAFYLTYRKQAVSCADGSCQIRAGSRTSKLLLWLVTISAIAFAAFPYYSGPIFQVQAQDNKPSFSANDAKLVVIVGGMSCSSCAIQIKGTLDKLPGVKSAAVSYEKSEAVIVYDPKATNDAAIRSAITELGYEVGESAKPAKAAEKDQRCLDSIQTAALKEEFNRSSDLVRVVAILSPTCGPCQRGRGVVGELFKKYDSDKLRGLVVWLPMKPADSAQAAWTESEKLQDQRIVVRGWDGKRAIANLFSKPLRLRKTAWDVYLVYAPGVRWQGTEPPAPNFWMHQLQQADQSLCLNPAVLSNQVERLLRSERGAGKQ
jgi:mercuric ion transport protein